VQNDYDAFVPQLSDVPEKTASFSIFSEYIIFKGKK
jgi:hypothetical protein